MAEYTCTISTEEYRELVLAAQAQRETEPTLNRTAKELAEAREQLEETRGALADAKQSSAYWYTEWGKLKARMEEERTGSQDPA